MNLFDLCIGFEVFFQREAFQKLGVGDLANQILHFSQLCIKCEFGLSEPFCSFKFWGENRGVPPYLAIFGLFCGFVFDILNGLKFVFLKFQNKGSPLTK